MKYAAIMNTRGYLPEQAEIPTFDTPREAWAYLADERDRAIDAVWQEGDPETDDACRELLYRAEGTEDPAVGVVYGATPGYDGSHDLDIAYSVVVAEDES